MTNGPARQGAVLCALLSGAAFVLLLVAHEAGGAGFDLPWSPTLGARLHFEVDRVGAVYGLLATGVGAAVFAYAAGDLPRAEPLRFLAFMVLFAVSMVALATAQDLVVLFVAWDLTAVCSYFLIAIDRHEKEARRAALMALLVTGVSAVALLIALVVLGERFGTFSIPRLAEEVPAAGGVATAAVLVSVAALAKSAQVPLHFWLPRAMVAPTPVSAYLHSAAMVAAGVLLLTRLHPLLAPTQAVLDGLVVAGLASMYVAGALALAEDRVKRLLAYSTIAQYGYVVVLLGLGAVGPASYYVLAHGIAKSALFMVAGALSRATGEDRLTRLGGLARERPALAVAAAACCASLAALPLTAGFFGDELLFKAAAGRGTVLAVLTVGGVALTFAYMLRFWTGLFAGPRRAPSERLGAAFTVPPLALAAIALGAGFVTGPLQDLAAVEAGYRLAATTENVMAVASWVAGAAVFAAAPRFRALTAAGRAAGPERIYVETLRGLNLLSDKAHAFEVTGLRGKLTAVLVPGGVLVGVALLSVATPASYEVGEVPTRELVLIVALAIVAIAALAVTRPRVHERMVVGLSAVGFGLAAVYALLGSPDVAVVAAVIETLLTLLFLGVIALIPDDVLRSEAEVQVGRARTLRDVAIATVAGAAALATVWSALSGTAPLPGVAAEHLRLTADAHGEDTVTVILADFRGLDTLGEVSVLMIALIGVAALLRRGRLW